MTRIHMSPDLRGGRFKLYIWILVLFWGASSLRASAQSLTDDALAAFRSADLDRAIELFTDVVKNPDADVESRKIAFQYLGRSYVAKQMHDDAKAAIENFVSLEPPLLELDPDVEPPPLMDVYYEVRRDLEDGYEVEKADKGLQTVAVIDFTNGSFGESASDYDPLKLGLASMMINFLGGATDLKVVERERIQWLLNELDLQQKSGKVDPETAVRVGKLLGAQSVLIGSFIVNGKEMYVGTRLVKVETGQVLTGEQLFGKKDDVFDLIQKLSLQTAQAINSTLDKDSIGGTDETRSLDAVMSYSQGLDLLEQESYAAAYNKFMEALDYDPGYVRAERKAESLRLLVN